MKTQTGPTKKEEALKEIASLEARAKELRKSFSIQVKTGNTIDRIKTFEDACEEIGENPSDDKFTKGSVDTIAYEKLKVITKALNGNWVPDWSNTDQKKWAPYFDIRSGFRFYHSDYGYDCTASDVGSRLCYETEALSNYSGKQFESIYKEYLA